MSRQFFHFYKILIFRAVTGVKGQKIAQDEKQQLHVSYLRNSRAYDHGFWHTCVK